MSGWSARIKKTGAGTAQGTDKDSLAAGLLGLRALGLVCPLQWDWPLLQRGQRVRGGTLPPLPAQRLAWVGSRGCWWVVVAVSAEPWWAVYLPVRGVGM